MELEHKKEKKTSKAFILKMWTKTKIEKRQGLKNEKK